MENRGNNILKLLKENYQTRILYPAILPFKNEGTTKAEKIPSLVYSLYKNN